MLNKLIVTHNSQTVTIGVEKLYGGVNYTHTTNDSSDFTVGTTACAKIEFVTDETGISVGDVCTYSVKFNEDSAYRQLGVFNITSIERQKNLFKVTAFDNINFFEKVIDDYWNNLTFPITLGNLFNGLCTYVNSSLTHTSSFTNSSYSIPRKTIDAGNMTGRVLLGYIAMSAGCYACADANGQIIFKTYSANNTVIDGSRYKTLELSEYTVPQIDRVWTGMEVSDVGVFYPTSGSPVNILRLTYDPLFFIESGEENTLRSALQAIYNQVHGFTYKKGEIVLYEDYSVSCGDILTLGTDSFLVMEKIITKNGVIFRCFGNPERENNTYFNNEVTKATSGVYHTIQNEMDSLTSTVGNLSGDVSTLSQNVSAIGASVSGKLDATGGQTGTTSCSWVLNSSSWSVYVGNGQTQSTLQFRVNSSGAYVKGQIQADSGYIGNLNLYGQLTLKVASPSIYLRGFATNDEGLGDGRILCRFADCFTIENVLNTGYAGITYMRVLNSNNQYSHDYSFCEYESYGVVGRNGSGASGYFSLSWLSLSNQSSSSDRDKKHSIADLDENYSVLFDNLHPVKFKFNNGTSDRYHTGLIAQEVVDAIENADLTTQDAGVVLYTEDVDYMVDKSQHKDDPDYVSPLPEKSWQIRYYELVPLCINEIQKLKARVAELERING